MYPYTATVTNVFARIKIGGELEGEVMIVNERASPYGAGWMIDGIKRLAFPPLLVEQKQQESNNRCIGVNAARPYARDRVIGGFGDSGDEADDSPPLPRQAGTGIVLPAPNGAPVRYRPIGGGAFASPDADFGTLVQWPDNRYTHTTRYGIVHEFNTQGLQTARIDRNGNRLIRVTDPVGLITHCAYSGGTLKTITDPANRVTTFNHDGNGNLTEVIYPGNSNRRFAYAGNLMVTQRDERRPVTTYHYDANQRMVRATLPGGAQREITAQRDVGMKALGPPKKPEPIFTLGGSGFPIGPISSVAVSFCEAPIESGPFAAGGRGRNPNRPHQPPPSAPRALRA
ncbi:MAG: hypothetical protein GKR94_27370 [Gammaproteobacteria bacterium]|nr:hypothetical protein [Gammaproteobacteria bacterium]